MTDVKPMTDTPGTLGERLRKGFGPHDPRAADYACLLEAADEIASLRARVEAKNDADLDRHIFAWFNDIDCEEMRRCLDAYDARQALKGTPDAE